MNYIDDEEMYYDIKKHQYILTPAAMENNYSISLQDTLDTDGAVDPQAVPQMFLRRVSEAVYSYIYLFSTNKRVTEYRISLPEFREGIKEAMMELAYSVLLTNTDPSLQWSGNNNKPLVVTPSVKSILRRYNLLFRGITWDITEKELATKGVDY